MGKRQFVGDGTGWDPDGGNACGYSSSVLVAADTVPQKDHSVGETGAFDRTQYIRDYHQRCVFLLSKGSGDVCLRIFTFAVSYFYLTAVGVRDTILCIINSGRDP